MKKAVFKIIKWALLLSYLILMLSFVNRKSNSIICSNTNFIIDKPHKFINETTVNKLLNTNNIKIDSCILNSINFDEIEKILETSPFIKDAEVYSKFNGQINIKIKQRNPVMRIITNNNEHYYIDDNCRLMPICDNYTANVIIVSGNISHTFVTSINTTDISTIDKSYHYTLRELYNFVNFLNGNELWRNQITQIYINDIKEIELIPRVGNHIIELGNLNDYKFKMGKLEAIYKKGFALTDWNIYSNINLKYSNQVICKKK
ncbi:MAG: hypothetical protein PHW82_12500 [Bacteroidales bacterium]|nr:hypothetical protein [Bacteroidales bacterium]